MLPQIEAVERLYAMRLIFGIPLIINSAARCGEHNKKVGGAEHSKHLAGVAFDISTNGLYKELIKSVAKLAGFSGIGIGQNFIHVDIRENAAEWTY